MENYEDIGGCYPPRPKVEAGFRGTGTAREERPEHWSSKRMKGRDILQSKNG